MAKLTRVQTTAIERALYHVKRAERYIMSDSVAVAHRSRGTTTLDYTRADGKALYEVEKAYGSDLCGLFDAIKGLERLLNPPQIETE